MAPLPKNPYLSFTGPAGVVVDLYDLTKPYAYENIFHVKMLAVGSFPSTEETFEKQLEKMGVFKEDLEATKAELAAHFEKTTLPYLFKEDFADKMVAQKAAARTKSKGIGGYRSERGA
ncbi:MAG: hypothetical protein C0608_05125 [Deltaproteobacteria bacterium]|nr:MAG: hypothetical protein C0608_05125 [Deltaproteobacteria bacterium]